MQFAHPWDDGFFALCVEMHSKCRIFTGETVDAFGEFIHVILQGGKGDGRLDKDKMFCLLRVTVFCFFTLLAGFIDMEMTGSGTWIDSCRKSSRFFFYFGRHRKGDFHNKAENLFSHHGEVCAGFRCESVSASTVDPKQSTNVSCINFIYILEKKRHQGNQANDRVIF